MQKILLSSSPKRDPPGLNRNCQYEKGHRRGCQRWHQGDNGRRRRGQFRRSVALVTRTSANRDLAAVMYGVIACRIFRWEFGFFEFFLFLQKFVILKINTTVLICEIYSQNFSQKNFSCNQLMHSAVFTVWKSAIKSDHHFCAKINIFSVKSTFLLKKLLKSWFDEIFFQWQ